MKTALGWTLLLSATSSFAQGPLTPPAGPPAPTMKTLVEVEPRTNLQATPAPAGVVTTDANYHFIINQPGSYYLSANLGVTKPNGIQINAEGVTLDLNGFQISRTSGGGNGIEIAASSHRASIRQGSIRGFTKGIESLGGSDPARACAFRDLAVSTCVESGIVAGIGAVLESCRVHNVGFTTNTSYGIRAGTGSTLSNCSVYGNAVNYGIYANGDSSLTNCTASNNTASSNNQAVYGIFAGTGSSLTNCTASHNQSGVFPSAGIATGNGCTITHCSADSNSSTETSTSTAGMGFSVGFPVGFFGGCTIQGCTAAFNQGDGININTNTVVRDNTCDSNGNSGDGAGIHSTNGDNRIEGNNVTGNDRGIDVDGTGSVIIRNTASGNTINYTIAVNNSYGAIVDDSGGGAPSVSGSNATSSFGSPNAWANFSY